MKRVIEMIAFMKHLSSKELKGFRGHSLINLNRSFIFPFDTEANISLILGLYLRIHALLFSQCSLKWLLYLGLLVHVDDKKPQTGSIYLSPLKTYRRKRGKTTSPILRIKSEVE